MTDLNTEEGPLDLDKAKALEDKHGFAYQTDISELIFAYIICHQDIGYAITKLTSASNQLADTHYRTVKRLFK